MSISFDRGSVATEIKINLADGPDAALEALHLEKGKPRTVWFAEISSGRRSFVPLLDARIILRLRSDKEAADSTVKLRPCDPAQLIEPWTAGFELEADCFEYRIEADRSGDREVLAASAVAEIAPAVVARIAAGEAGPETAFDAHQRQLLQQCGEIPNALAEPLVALGPIAASKWKRVVLNGFDGNEVAAERWTVGDLDFLELSIRLDPGVDPVPVQARFEAAVAGSGLSISDAREPKTRLVLEALAMAVGRRGVNASPAV
ncbi:hypothetical protein ACIBJI_41240 [Nocardia sp. NPDC050408]|uniref:hypothetical protein n=1 Tax=Nocardia sp. NPDC050408 TaxID=3364319 RepID=UPI0037BC945F